MIHSQVRMSFMQRRVRSEKSWWGRMYWRWKLWHMRHFVNWKKVLRK